MKRFRFPLQSVATVRSWREREAREQLAARMHELNAAEQALRECQERLSTLEEVVRAARSGTFRPAEQSASLAAYQNEKLAVKRAEAASSEAKCAVDRAREAWQVRRNELRAVEKLEQRARHAHRLENESAEQTLLDEIASIRGPRMSSVIP